MATIKDIAKKVDVSMSTVSHVINGTHFVSKQLKTKILNAMEELNYYPNLVARSLRKKKTNIIGLILLNISDFFQAELTEKIENELSLYNYNIIICDSKFNRKKELEQINNLRNRMVDGILLMPFDKTFKNLKKIDYDIPIVLLDKIENCYDISYININNEIGCYNATNYLISLGHEKIGFIDRNSDSITSIERKNGFIKALKKNKFEINEQMIVKTESINFKGGYNAAIQLLDRIPKLSGIIAYADILALGAIRAIVDMKKKVPEDISIIGFDDMLIDKYFTPRLTTVHIPINKLSKKSVGILMRNIENNNKNIETVLLNPTLIIRESTAVKK